MNIKRGLFRLWLVSAVLFAVAIFALEFEHIRYEFEWAAFKPVGPDGIFHSPWELLLEVSAIAIGVPLVVLIVARAIFWAIGGFGNERK
jgi:hypothetical protein